MLWLARKTELACYGPDNNTILSSRTGFWTEMIDSFKLCPHPLEGKTLRVGSQGTNPFIYSDFDRNVAYNEKGQPLG